tara:strand:+ start:396 stop:1112 length:717 start_codon:yes stop_codon:yes gene_type:complete
MYDIAIIGGTLPSLISSIRLSNDHKICIIDINQEIGFPTNFPGFIKNQKLLDEFLNEKDKLYVKKNHSGFGLRSEWLMKYLTHTAARHGVDILNRTRVSNVFYENFFNIELIGGGPKNQTIKSKIIIDETERIYLPPGDKKHTLLKNHKLILSINEEQKEYFVGTIPYSKSQNISNYRLKIDRDDELTEFWFDQKPLVDINWIEIKNSLSFSNSEYLNIDKYIQLSNDIIKLSLKILT